MAMKDLPSEIVEYILLRLPVKSLLRSKCICKLWYNIISCPQFAKNHLRHPQTQGRTRLCCIGYEHCGNVSNVVVYLRSTTVINDNGELLDLDRLDDFDETLNLANRQHFLGSCDGLFYVVDSFHDIILWNPSIRQHNQLPPNPKLPNHEFSSYSWQESPGNKRIKSYYGFGCDSCSDDYKIVAVLIPNYESNMSINVFSLKSYAWRSIVLQEKNRALTQAHVLEERALVFHGAVHWLAFDSNNLLVILAFDFEKEQFKEIRIPVNVGAYIRSVGLKVIEERLCLYGQGKDHQIEKWVMEKYRDESSWTKLPSPHSYVHINHFNKRPPEEDYILRGFLNNKHLLMIDFRELILWDDKENTEHNVTATKGLMRMRTMIRFFTETLVSPHSSFQFIHPPIISNDERRE